MDSDQQRRDPPRRHEDTKPKQTILRGFLSDVLRAFVPSWRHEMKRLRHAIAIMRLGAGVHAGFAAIACRMRRTTSSSVGYGERSAGRSGSGISSMRYAVPGALTPVTAVVMCTRASRLVCVTFGSSTIVEIGRASC